MVMDALRLLTRGSGIKLTGNHESQYPSIPSAGPTSPESKTATLNKKRKRAEFEQDNNGIHPVPVDKIRQIQATHKIKINDLKALHKHHDSTSRKSQKETSRVFAQPLLKFSDLRHNGINGALLANLAEQGYKEPTAVQLATIPLLLPKDGQEPNLLTVAPTGSGKTLAFMIPLIERISRIHQNHDSEAPQRQVSAIVLAPTRELVTQIVNEGRKLALRTGVRITAFTKGMRLHDDIAVADNQASDDSDEQESAGARIVKADILVSTPLSLLHSITPTGLTTPLPLMHITNLILDEADVLLDPLFRDQTLSIWSSCMNKSLRTSFWSATIGSNIEELAISQIASREDALTLRRKHCPPLLRCIIGLKDTSLPNINHKLIYASTEAGKLTGIRQILRPPPSTKTVPLLRPPFLIFTQTIPRAQSLHSELLYDFPPSTTTDVPRIAVLHSSLSSTQRSKIMQNFRLGKIWILITTDLLSRGIDFRGVNGVVNYDIPTTSASYVHRAGRTGRAGREGGICITFYTREDVMYLRPIANVIAKSQNSHRKNVNGFVEDGQASVEPNSDEAIPSWLLDSLPYLTKEKKKDLKQRGVEVRRGVKESDDKKERRKKRRNTIGTKSGYEKKLEDRRRGMVEGSKRRKDMEQRAVFNDEDVGSDGDDFTGFD